MTPRVPLTFSNYQNSWCNKGTIRRKLKKMFYFLLEMTFYLEHIEELFGGLFQPRIKTKEVFDALFQPQTKIEYFFR